MHKNIVLVLIVCALILSSSVLMAAGDAAAAKSVVPLCQGCHGMQGEGKDALAGMPAMPRLAGQIEAYLAQAIKDYQSGARSNAMMGGMAKGLSATDVDNVAAFYAALK